jgi:hypothetical protein
MVSLPALAGGLAKRGQTAVQAAVQNFFRYHLRDGCGYSEQDIRDRRKWFTSDLYRLLLYEKQRERAFAKQHPDEVPYFDGDPFTNSQEYPAWFAVGSSTREGASANVKVTFYFGRGTRGEPRTSTVLVRQEAGRWRIDDIIDSTGKSLKKLLGRPNYEG